jgi:hypothetical protein
MTSKIPPRPDRLRRIPPSFSWVDHRLVRQNRLRECDPTTWALYLFLVTVADEQGLSYYSEASLCRFLRVDFTVLSEARQQLIQNDLVAYKKPLYQVLDLDSATIASAPRNGETLSVAAILKKVMGGAQ